MKKKVETGMIVQASADVKGFEYCLVTVVDIIEDGVLGYIYYPDDDGCRSRYVLISLKEHEFEICKNGYPAWLVGERVLEIINPVGGTRVN